MNLFSDNTPSPQNAKFKDLTPMNVDRKNSRISAFNGFTLLEVLVSLAVLAVAVTILAQLFSSNLRTISRSGDVISASVRAEARIREIVENLPAAVSSWSEFTEEGYRVDVSIQEVLKERTDNLPFKMMEVSLTIGWNEGLKEKTTAIRTMKMVDRVADPRAPARGRL